MSNSALIVIDMLNDFVSPDGALYVGDTVKHIIPEIQKKISKYRADADPVIYLCDSHAEDDKEFEMFPPHCIANGKGAEIYKDLRPNAGETIVYKTRFSGFFNTNLDAILKEKNLDAIELCGVCTNICVLYTCADARMRGYNVTVDRRCVDSFDRAAHEFALKEMERVLGAKII
ncbi:MAG: isochorismatase family cysteine hydrolase [bacterium]